MAESHRDEIAKLEALFQSNPGGRSFTHLAEAYRKAGEAERALEVVQRGLVRHPDYASAYVVLGRVQQDLGNLEEATIAFGRVLELDPENRVALRALGDLARQGGRLDEALERYRHLRTLDPSDEEIEAAMLAVEAELRERGPAAAEVGVPEVAPFHGDYVPPPAIEAPPVGAIELPGGGDGWAQSSASAVEPAPPDGTELGRLLSLDELLPASSAGAPAEGGAAGYELDTDLRELTAADPRGSAGADATAGLDDAGGIDARVEPAEPSPAAASAGPGAVEGGLPLRLVLDEARGAAYDSELDTAGPGGEVVTETMAELYRAQGLPGRAAEIYRALLAERPGDERLALRLLEVEAELDGVRLAIPREDAAASGAAAAPAGAAATSRAAPESVQPVVVEEIESAWTGPSGARVEDPGLYAWSDEGADEDGGRTIREYFGALLAWRASDGGHGSAPAVAAAPVWAAEPQAAEPAAGAAGPEAANVEGAGAVYAPAQAEPAGTAPAASQPEAAARAEDRAPGGEDDLEVFRAWLQSLKR